MMEENPRPIDYATASNARPVPSWLSATALYCGLIAAGVGILIAVAYSVTEIQVFRLLGTIWLLLGGLIVLAGFGFVLTHFCWPRGATRRRNTRAIIALVILLLNFPIALGCIITGAWSSDRVTTIVYNDGTTPIDSVLIAHGTRNLRIGPIAPGQSTSGVFIPNYGDVTAIVRIHGNDGSIQIVGHGDAGEIGSPMTVHIDDAGKATCFMR